MLRTTSVTASLLLLLGCPAPQQDPPAFDAELAADLQLALTASARSVDAPGVAQGVRLADGRRWIGVEGYADPATGRPVAPDDAFRIGSVTKTFTASVILQLIAEGDLALEDTVEDFWPDLVPDGDQVTIERLLRHRSGITSYTDTTYFVAHLTQATPPRRIVEESVATGRVFAPGESWAYSNTNYILLGMITEELTGRAWHEAVRERLLDPVGLEGTWFEGPEEPRREMVRGHLDGIDTTDALDTSWSWSSGGLVSTADDQVTWLTALLGGHVLAEEQLAWMLTDSGDGAGGAAGYGMGMYLLEADEGRYVGHTGSTQGFQSDLFALEGPDALVVTLVNDFLSEASTVAEGAWEVLLER